MITYLSKLARVNIRHYAKAGFWVSVSQVISIAGALLISVVLANLLPENEFGTYRYLISLGSIIVIFGLSGMTQSTLQATASGYRSYLHFGTNTQLRWSLLSYSVGLVIAAYYLINGDFVLSLGCVVVTFLANISNTYQNIFAYFEGRQNQRLIAKLSLIKTVSIIIATVLPLFFSQNILFLVIGFLGSQALCNVLFFFFYKPKDTDDLSAGVLKKFTNVAKHASVRNIFSTLTTKADSILVFQQIGSKELAIYTIANILPEQIKGQFKNLSRLVLPRYVTYNEKDIRTGMLQKSFSLFIFSCGLTIAYILCVPLVYKVFFPSYVSAIVLSQIAALAFPASAGMLPMNALQAKNLEREQYNIIIIGSVVSIGILVAGTVTYGILGVTIGKVISRYIYTILAYGHYWRASSSHIQ